MLALRQEVKQYKFRLSKASFALQTKQEELTQHVSSHGKLVENVSSENSYDTKKSSKGDF
jgi:hypothetical protein